MSKDDMERLADETADQLLKVPFSERSRIKTAFYNGMIAMLEWEKEQLKLEAKI